MAPNTAPASRLHTLFGLRVKPIGARGSVAEARQARRAGNTRAAIRGQIGRSPRSRERGQFRLGNTYPTWVGMVCLVPIRGRWVDWTHSGEARDVRRRPTGQPKWSAMYNGHGPSRTTRFDRISGRQCVRTRFDRFGPRSKGRYRKFRAPSGVSNQGPDRSVIFFQTNGLPIACLWSFLSLSGDLSVELERATCLHAELHSLYNLQSILPPFDILTSRINGSTNQIRTLSTISVPVTCICCHPSITDTQNNRTQPSRP